MNLAMGVGGGDIIQLSTRPVTATKRDGTTRIRPAGAVWENPRKKGGWSWGEEGRARRLSGSAQGLGTEDKARGSRTGTSCGQSVWLETRGQCRQDRPPSHWPREGETSLSQTRLASPRRRPAAAPPGAPGFTSQRAADRAARSLGCPRPATGAAGDTCADPSSRTQPGNHAQLPANSSRGLTHAP